MQIKNLLNLSFATFDIVVRVVVRDFLILLFDFFERLCSTGGFTVKQKA